jgi:allantoicase
MNEFTQFVDLASQRLGGCVVLANDEFFGAKENLLKQGKPIFVEGKYTDRGHWMDGWETRRRRTPGYDWCIVRLGLPGILRRAVVDTSFFTGNYPARFALEGCDLGDSAPYKDETIQRRWRLRGVLRTCGSRFTPMAVWRDCGCTARWCRA